MNKYFLRKDSGSIFLCCGKAGCPSVSQSDDGMVIIKDDDGNQVKMKIEEAKLLGPAVQSIEDGVASNEDESFPEAE